ncbi:hypothetical protein R9C00_10245 [Flammeovirgaceae bacterium SG7u.111]|nr:hypothetical protein [Flammeovirgaceae bacterium SG7u.132]WPO37832.1 hypothetical protein R9C00_10245 [Flammeovirgaceae bacterium SG7u.111]
MGFWDKVKAVKNMVTGGAATVYVEVQEAKLGEPFKVVVKANVKDQDLSINGVYLKVRGMEKVTVPNVRVPADVDFDGDFEIVGTDLHRSAVTNEFEQNINGPQELEANQEYVWEAEITLPQGALPSYRGFNAAHEWEIFAGLDARGNDPDSDWVDFVAY